MTLTIDLSTCGTHHIVSSWVVVVQHMNIIPEIDNKPWSGHGKMRGGRRESNIPTTTTLMITDKHILVLFSYLYNDVDTPSDRYIAQVCEHTLVIETVKYPTARNRVPWYDHESHEKWSITIKSGERVSNEIDWQKRHLEYRDYKACKQRKQRRFRWKWTDDTGHAYFNSRVDLKNNRIDK